MRNKKLLLLMYVLLPALAFLSSCLENDPVGHDSGDLVTISVQLPYDLGTRSTSCFGDDTSGLDLLQWSVFEVGGEEGSEAYTHIFDDERSISREGGDLSETIDLQLMRGKRYVVAACVSHEGNDFASFSKGKITVNYENSKCNDGDAEMFAGCSDPFSSDDAEVVSIELTRPFAQVNWGSSDLEDPTVKRHLPETSATVTVTSPLYTVKDVVTGELSGATSGDVILGTVEDCSKLPQEGFPSVDASVSMNKLVAMNYVLSPDVESTIDCNITFTGNLSADVNANSAAICANYRTNIYGDFLTFPEFINITVNSTWSTTSYTIGEAKAIWEEFKSGKDLIVPEGKVLDLTPFDYCEVKGGQNIKIDGVLKLHTDQLRYKSSQNSCSIIGTGMILTGSSHSRPIYVNGGKLKISDITIKSSYRGNGASAIYASGSVVMENVVILCAYTAVYFSSGTLEATNCHIDFGSNPKYDSAIYVGGKTSKFNNCIFDSYIDINISVTAGTSTFTDCNIESYVEITGGTNKFEGCHIHSSVTTESGNSTFTDCKIGSYISMSGGVNTFNDCNITSTSEKGCVNMTAGSCTIDGGVYRSIFDFGKNTNLSSDKCATFIMDNKFPRLIIKNGDFYSNSSYTILRKIDTLKSTIVSEWNGKTENKDNKISVADVTQEMLTENSKNSYIKLQGGRFEKGTFNYLTNSYIPADDGFNIIDCDEYSSGFRVVKRTDISLE